MTRYLNLLILLTISILLTSCQPAATPTPSSTTSPYILAHRGLSQHAPENTLPAFAAAIDLGLDIEVDVYQTTDNQIIIIHDDTVDRTTNGTGKVIEKTLAELKELDAGLWFDQVFRGQKIPTLKEVLQLVKTNQWRPTKVAINMKIISPGIEERIVRLVEEEQLLDQVFAFNMNFESAVRFRKANPKFPLSVPGWTWDKNGDHLPGIDEVKAAHEEDRKVWVISACMNNEPKCWIMAKENDADGFLTNYPIEARELWRQSTHPDTKYNQPPSPREKAIEPPKTGPETRPKTPTPIIFPHRGMKMFAPEYTLPALGAAVSLGFSVELDLRITKDSQLVVIYDETVDRTTNGSGKVADMTLAELRQLDAGSWFDPAYSSVKIPSLDEALACISTRQRQAIKIIIHLQKNAPLAKNQMIQILEKHNLTKQVLVNLTDVKTDLDFEDDPSFWKKALDDGDSSLRSSYPLEVRSLWRNVERDALEVDSKIKKQ